MLNKTDVRKLFAAQQILEREKHNVIAKEIDDILSAFESKPEKDKSLEERLYHDGWLEAIKNGVISKDKKYGFSIRHQDHGEYTLIIYNKEGDAITDAALVLEFYTDEDDAKADMFTLGDEWYDFEGV